MAPAGLWAIHPVAGRMPGHMNVLLAEANVPYEQLVEMDAINPLMPTMDVAIVIGANDVVNPAAARDPSSPIYGMPIMRAHEARTVVCLKRGRGTGFSGLENQLFLLPSTRMLYGDAKGSLQGVVAEFKSLAAGIVRPTSVGAGLVRARPNIGVHEARPTQCAKLRCAPHSPAGFACMFA